MSLGRNTIIVTLTRLAKEETFCNINWSTQNKAKTQVIKQVSNLLETKEFTNQLLAEIPSKTNVQLDAAMQHRIKTVTPSEDIPIPVNPKRDIPEQARA